MHGVLYIPIGVATLASMATLLWLICQNCIMQFVANLVPRPPPGSRLSVSCSTENSERIVERG